MDADDGLIGSLNPAPGVCLPVIVKFCQNHKLPYNYTVFPNYIGHFGQLEAQVELEQFDALVDVQCFELVPLYLCSLFVPKCSSIGKVSWPPRGFDRLNLWPFVNFSFVSLCRHARIYVSKPCVVADFSSMCSAWSCPSICRASSSPTQTIPTSAWAAKRWERWRLASRSAMSSRAIRNAAFLSGTCAMESSIASIRLMSYGAHHATVRRFTAVSGSAWATGTFAMAPWLVLTLKTSATASGWAPPTATWAKARSRCTRRTRSAGNRLASATGCRKSHLRKSARCSATVRWTRVGWWGAAPTTPSSPTKIRPHGCECRNGKPQICLKIMQTATTIRLRLWRKWHARTSSAVKCEPRSGAFPRRG